MKPIQINTKREGHSYPIFIGRKQSAHLVSHIRKMNVGTIVIITDTTVKKLYGLQLQKTLQKNFHRVLLVSFPAGEKYKTISQKNSLDRALLKGECGRDTVILALGGGVVGDMAGFVASTYMRGIPYIQIPSSIGGKTGIDTPYGKNLIGTFWQPDAVFIDLDFLSTLPGKHWQSGLMEAIKMSIITDPSMILPLIEVMRARSGNNLKKIILKSITHKAKIVERDEKEGGERMILNFGHTIGHAIEKVSNYSVLHGIAVGLGMLVETRISHELGILSTPSLKQVENVLKNAGVDTKTLRKWSVNDIIAATRYDKKRQGKQVRYVLLEKLGKVYRKENKWAHPVSESIVRKALRSPLNS